MEKQKKKKTDGTALELWKKKRRKVSLCVCVYVCAALGQTVIIIIIIIAIVFWRINFPHPSSRLPKGFKLRLSLSLCSQLAVVLRFSPHRAPARIKNPPHNCIVIPMSQKIVHEREQEMMIIDELLSYPPTTLLGIFCPRSYRSCCFGLVDDWTRLYTVASSSAAAAAAVALFLNTHGSHLYRKNIKKAGLCWPV